MSKTIYAVGALCKEQHVLVFGTHQQLTMKWADGMVGCLPVFSSKRKAERYAKGKQIIPMVRDVETKGQP